jgi:hypothetical protein
MVLLAIDGDDAEQYITLPLIAMLFEMVQLSIDREDVPTLKITPP